MTSENIGLFGSLNILNLYKLLFIHNDSRTRSWFLTSSPYPLLVILVAYLIFCLYAGPRFMRNRKPFELKSTLMVYNSLQVVLSYVLCYKSYTGGWDGQYNYSCEPLTYNTDPTSMRMADAVWLYYMAKMTELLDTVFFVLRKKDRQVSFLHLYHHTMMPVGAYIAVKHFAGGHGTIIILINSFIHVVMYTYYMLAAMGPKVQKYLWWKKYLTMMQILQFLIVFVHMLHIQFRPSCNYPKLISGLLSLNALVFTYMFSSFYVENYKKETHRRKKADEAAAAIKQD